MSHYVLDRRFDIYFSGVYNGNITFKETYVELCDVDRRTRAQLKREPFDKNKKNTLIDYLLIHSKLAAYADCKWEGDKVTLADGSIYSRYLTATGMVDGKEVTSQLWAQRKSTGVIDIVTVDGEIVAFSNPGRVSSEIAVVPGYEKLTPLVKYDDPLLSKAEYGINHLGNLFVPTRDGLNLATEVFLPEGIKLGEKVPAIVVRTCYGKPRDILRCWHWTARGYAFVIQDVRGRSDSDGELEPFQHEREDTDDLFNWIVQQEWSDGNIGMWGASYLGYTTTAAATSGNPHLKTAISEVNVGSPFTDTARRGGTICSWPLLCWTLGQSMSNRIDFGVFAGETINVEEAVRHRPITEIPEKIIGKKSGPWELWREHYYYDEFWRHSDNTAHSHQIKIPMLIMSGWYDGDALGVQETWRFLTKHDVPGRRIILGPWPHNLNAFRDCDDLEFGDNAVDYDFDTRIIRWFDRYLKGIDNGEDQKPRASYYVVGENQWRESEDWNPRESKLVNLYLASNGHANSMFGDGRIVLQPEKETGSDTYIYDPNQPIGDRGHVRPYHCNHIQLRNDCLVYDTEALSTDVAMAGNVYAEFYASSSAVDTDFIVRVSDVDEKGIARKISDNVIRAEFRKGYDKPELLEPGKVEKFEMEMYFNGYVFKKGHKIRIDITSSNYYEFFPNTNTGINPYEDPAPVVALNTIYHGAAYPSHVKLPVLYGL
ncbi:CocE/NonD family hydrolase [Brevibacillus nitrificans]|uniref:CocE/NonD family hydrolase n=1 Tax=Brevibacillus nitrificans TaxID=651560 RepID=UPI002858D004|nr:CocE/NonD family hydrolase [Brevibacillus nitrificans]MDR7316102.1 putative CocE/NonD family hydrolase [Brevibacillus nitrificans]